KCYFQVRNSPYLKIDPGAQSCHLCSRRAATLADSAEPLHPEKCRSERNTAHHRKPTIHRESFSSRKPRLKRRYSPAARTLPSEKQPPHAIRSVQLPIHPEKNHANPQAQPLQHQSQIRRRPAL